MTREEWYQERIAHLRTGLEFARDDINVYKRMLGMSPNTAIDLLLSEDVERSVKQDLETPK